MVFSGLRSKTYWATALTCICFAGPASGQEIPVPPVRQLVDDNGVSLEFGDFTLDQPQLHIGDGELSFSVQRHWFNSNWRDSLIGSMKWSGTTNPPNGRLTVSIGKMSSTFRLDALPIPSIINFSEQRDGSTLHYNSATRVFTFIARDGTVAEFLPSSAGTNLPQMKFGRLSKITYPNGIVEDYFYRNNTNQIRLQSAKSSLGYQIKYQYSFDFGYPDMVNLYYNVGRVTIINNLNYYCTTEYEPCDNMGKSVAYGGGDLIPNGVFQLSDPEGALTRFDFDNRKNLKAISLPTKDTMPGGFYAIYNPIVTLGYDLSRFITSLNNQNGNYYYKYNAYISPIGIEQKIERTNPDGSIKLFKIEKAISALLEETDELGRVTNYDYDSHGRLTKVTYPEGNSSIFTLDDRGNVLSAIKRAKPGSGLADISVSAVYPVTCVNRKTCNKPTSVTDENGNTTTYVYDPNHGGVLTETKPAGANGVAPVRRVSYTQRYAWMKNAAGAHVQAASPIWVKAEERTCRSTATVGNGCAGGAADEVITSYDYGPANVPANLLVRAITVTAANGAGVIETLRTCYNYDEYGRKISETQPKGALASCP